MWSVPFCALGFTSSFARLVKPPSEGGTEPWLGGLDLSANLVLCSNKRRLAEEKTLLRKLGCVAVLTTVVLSGIVLVTVGARTQLNRCGTIISNFLSL